MKIKSIIAASLATVTVGTFTVLGMTGVLTDNENATSSAESNSEVNIVSEIMSSQEALSETTSSEPTPTEIESSEVVASVAELSVASSDTAKYDSETGQKIASEYYIDNQLITTYEARSSNSNQRVVTEVER